MLSSRCGCFTVPYILDSDFPDFSLAERRLLLSDWLMLLQQTYITADIHHYYTVRKEIFLTNILKTI